MKPIPGTFLALPLALLAAPGAAQEILHTFDGTDPESDSGHSVDGAGDVDGDGYDDVIVGAPFHDVTAGGGEGRAYVISGASGGYLHLLDGEDPGDQFGWSVGGAGDVDGDGLDDVGVGAYQATVVGVGLEAGRVHVYSGFDGAILCSFDGEAPGDRFGKSVSDTGDVDGDGTPDLIASSSGQDGGAWSSGVARVFSGADGALLWRFEGESPSDAFGYSVGGAGDANGDGFADLIAGAIDDDDGGTNAGSARLFAGGPPPPLVLGATLMTAGATTTLDVTGATPFGPVFVAFSLSGLGTTPVPPLGIALSLASPALLGILAADAAGVASLTGTVPPVLAGQELWVQVAEPGGTSNWVRREVL